MKTPEQIGREVIDSHYGIGTDWEEPNDRGEEGFTRAQAESDIDAHDICELIEEGIAKDHAQLREALHSSDAVPGIRLFSRTSVSALIDAYVEWDGEVDTFVLAWENYTAGLDFPCPQNPAGIHSTYLTYDGSCDFCGDKNRS
ncbi:hypothetical protein [Psychromicrobium sp. YIM B11713]|uniref:hypothetical protein n=1 Tax=Psychromicrobium sp. YIM B11713 TaxID=3145233 RepID=UPI00374EE181